MLLLGGILLAVFVIPWPWGIFAIVGGALLDIGESAAFLRWSRRRKSPVGAEALVGQTALVATPTQVRVAGELWAARSDDPLRVGEEVVVRVVDGLTLVVE
jgi:membrane protein implicated in regulation of membrane protease activity